MDINLDLTRRTSEIPRFVMQHEVDSRTLNFTILNNGVAFDLTSKTVTLCMEKPDGELIYNAVTVPVGTAGKCNITLTAQAQAAAGVAKCWIKIVDGASVTYSPQFDIEIREVTDFSGAVESTSEFTALETALATVTDYDSRLAAAESDIGALETADSQNVKITGDQTIAGVKTLSSSPIVPTPTADMQAATKKYVDDEQALDVKLTGDQTVAGVKTFSSPPIVPTPTTDMQASTKKYTDDHAALSLLTGTVHGLAVTSGSGNLTPSAETGTLTTATATYAYYRVGKMLTYHIYVSIVNKGTGDGGLDVSGLPINFNTLTCGTGVDSNTGVPLRIYTTTSGLMRIYRYDNTSAIVTGATLSLDITGITA